MTKNDLFFRLIAGLLEKQRMRMCRYLFYLYSKGQFYELAMQIVLATGGRLFKGGLVLTLG